MCLCVLHALCKYICVHVCLVIPNLAPDFHLGLGIQSYPLVTPATEPQSTHPLLNDVPRLLKTAHVSWPDLIVRESPHGPFSNVQLLRWPLLFWVVGWNIYYFSIFFHVLGIIIPVD